MAGTAVASAIPLTALHYPFPAIAILLTALHYPFPAIATVLTALQCPVPASASRDGPKLVKSEESSGENGSTCCQKSGDKPVPACYFSVKGSQARFRAFLE